MTQIFTAIETNLSDALERVEIDVDFKKENTPFTPNVERIWVRPTMLVGRSNTASLGYTHHSQYFGLFKVDVFERKNQGTSNLNEIADSIVSYFKENNILDDNDVVVYVEEVWRETLQYEDVWVMAPVFISWNCFIQHNS